MAKTIGELTAAITLLEDYLMECEEDTVDNYKLTLAQLRNFIVESDQLQAKLNEVASTALVMSIIF